MAKELSRDVSQTLILSHPSPSTTLEPPAPGPVPLHKVRKSEATEDLTLARGLHELRARVNGKPAVSATGKQCWPGSQLALPPSAGWPRRIAAFTIDYLCLVVAGQLLAAIFAEQLFALGPWGRLIGFSLALAYFGLLNSPLTGGQTVGKRILRIAVRADSGQPPRLVTSFGRALVLTIPFLVNGASFGGHHPTTMAIQTALVVGLGFGGLAFTITNRQRFQTLHDALCRTQVISLTSAPAPADPQTPGRFARHLVPIAGILVVALGTTLTLGSVVRAHAEPLWELQQTLSEDARVFDVQATIVNTQSDEVPARTLKLTAWYRGLPTEEQRDTLAVDLARQTASLYTGIDSVEEIKVTITAAYDIGIARKITAWTTAFPVAAL